MDARNPIRRKLSPESPIYIPFIFNLFLLILGGCIYVYNVTGLPSIDKLAEVASASPINAISRKP